MAAYLYTTDHAWVAAEGDRARVGLSDFAQAELGEVAFVDLPAVGREVRQGEAVCTVDSLKSASEVYTPVSGTVVEVNTHLERQADPVNRDPLGRGWLFVVQMSHPEELRGLLDERRYAEFLRQEQSPEAGRETGPGPDPE